MDPYRGHFFCGDNLTMMGAMVTAAAAGSRAKKGRAANNTKAMRSAVKPVTVAFGGQAP